MSSIACSTSGVISRWNEYFSATCSTSSRGVPKPLRLPAALPPFLSENTQAFPVGIFKHFQGGASQHPFRNHRDSHPGDEPRTVPDHFDLAR